MHNYHKYKNQSGKQAKQSPLQGLFLLCCITVLSLILLQFLPTTHIPTLQSRSFHQKNDEGPRRYCTLHVSYMHAIQWHNSVQFKPNIHLTIESFVIVQNKTEYMNREDVWRCQVYVVNCWNNYQQEQLTRNVSRCKEIKHFFSKENLHYILCICVWLEFVRVCKITHSCDQNKITNHRTLA